MPKTLPFSTTPTVFSLAVPRRPPEQNNRTRSGRLHPLPTIGWSRFPHDALPIKSLRNPTFCGLLQMMRQRWQISFPRLMQPQQRLRVGNTQKQLLTGNSTSTCCATNDANDGGGPWRLITMQHAPSGRARNASSISHAGGSHWEAHGNCQKPGRPGISVGHITVHKTSERTQEDRPSTPVLVRASAFETWGNALNSYGKIVKTTWPHQHRPHPVDTIKPAVFGTQITRHKRRFPRSRGP